MKTVFKAYVGNGRRRGCLSLDNRTYIVIGCKGNIFLGVPRK